MPPKGKSKFLKRDLLERTTIKIHEIQTNFYGYLSLHVCIKRDCEKIEKREKKMFLGISTYKLLRNWGRRGKEKQI